MSKALTSALALTCVLGAAACKHMEVSDKRRQAISDCLARCPKDPNQPATTGGIMTTQTPCEENCASSK